MFTKSSSSEVERETSRIPIQASVSTPPSSPTSKIDTVSDLKCNSASNEASRIQVVESDVIHKSPVPSKFVMRCQSSPCLIDTSTSPKRKLEIPVSASPKANIQENSAPSLPFVSPGARYFTNIRSQNQTCSKAELTPVIRNTRGDESDTNLPLNPISFPSHINGWKSMVTPEASKQEHAFTGLFIPGGSSFSETGGILRPRENALNGHGSFVEPPTTSALKQETVTKAPCHIPMLSYRTKMHNSTSEKNMSDVQQTQFIKQGDSASLPFLETNNDPNKNYHLTQYQPKRKDTLESTVGFIDEDLGGIFHSSSSSSFVKNDDESTFAPPSLRMAHRVGSICGSSVTTLDNSFHSYIEDPNSILEGRSQFLFRGDIDDGSITSIEEDFKGKQGFIEDGIYRVSAYNSQHPPRSEEMSSKAIASVPEVKRCSSGDKRKRREKPKKTRESSRAKQEKSAYDWLKTIQVGKEDGFVAEAASSKFLRGVMGVDGKVNESCSGRNQISAEFSQIKLSSDPQSISYHLL